MRRDRLPLLVGAALMIPAGCNRQPPPAAGAAGPAAPAVAVVRPERRAIQRVVEQPGAATPTEETRLFAKFPGFVKTIGTAPNKPADGKDRRLDIGSRVTAGQLLAELAIPEVEQEAKQKAALVKQAEAEVE